MIAANEELVTFQEALSLIPKRNGRDPHLSILYRWTSEGLKGVRLEYIQTGGVRCTSKEAIRRFFDRLTEASGAGCTSSNKSEAVHA